MTEVHDLQSALRRIAELEAELAARPKPRAVRKSSTALCQVCGDGKADKITFLGLALCSDPKPCAARARRASSTGKSFMLHGDYRTRREAGVWVARYMGDVIAADASRDRARQAAFSHFLGERVSAAA